jgi:hypothetical protein
MLAARRDKAGLTGQVVSSGNRREKSRMQKSECRIRALPRPLPHGGGRARGPAAGFLLTVAIFAGQTALSVFWTQRFRFGPVEWLWRSLTYWRVQPLRLAPA